MKPDSARARALDETRTRILDVARELLGQDPDIGMGEIANAAGVVRRTIYGHFPSRNALVRALAQRAAAEMTQVLTQLNAGALPADRVWAMFVVRVWPLADRYRVLLALRRSEQGKEIHALLSPVDQMLADLVSRGQREGAFGRHLQALLLGQLAYSVVFAIADAQSTDETLDVRAAIVASLFTLGVAAARAADLATAEALP